MAEYLKTGASEEAKASEDAKVREIVEGILADIEARGDAAVREYSQKFDGWSPDDFRLDRAHIDRCYEQVSKQSIADIEFARSITWEQERLGTASRKGGQEK